jgi:hypothetical protein
MNILAARLAVIATSIALLAGCGGGPEDTARAAPVSEDFLTAPVWDDGAAEVAFYRVERTRTPYGEGEEQSFLVGTYVVKHEFSPERMSKANGSEPDAQPSFKLALFYQFASGGYEYKRAWVTNARQHDLRPYKASFTMFDWCANSYRELAIPEDGRGSFLYRSDDYGNASGDFDYRGGAYPPALIPMLVRAMDFSAGEVAFDVLLDDGSTVAATARLAGLRSVRINDEEFEGEEVIVTYAAEVPSVIAERADSEERYVRAPAGERHLLEVAGASGAYRMTLVEAVRSAYWEEDVFDRLQVVGERP